MSDFYSTAAQIIPVLIIVLAFDVRENGPGYRASRRFIFIGGALECAAFWGLFMSRVDRPDAVPAFVPWVGESALLVGIVGMICYVTKVLAKLELHKEVQRLVKCVYPDGRPTKKS